MTAGDLTVAVPSAVIDRRYSGFSSIQVNEQSKKNLPHRNLVGQPWLPAGMLRESGYVGFGVRFRRLPPDVGLPRSIRHSGVQGLQRREPKKAAPDRSLSATRFPEAMSKWNMSWIGLR